MSRIFYKIKESDIERLEYTVIDDSEFGCESLLLSTLFDKYEVPEEYRILFFYKSLFNNDIKEFFTDTSLQYANHSLKGDLFKLKKEKSKDIKHFYRVNINGTCNEEFIKNFFHQMDENNFLECYLRALNEYFFLKLNSYHITTISDSEDTIEAKRRMVNKNINEAKKTR